MPVKPHVCLLVVGETDCLSHLLEADLKENDDLKKNQRVLQNKDLDKMT